MFYENFKKVCKLKGTNATAVIKTLKMSSSNLSRWKAGETPNYSTMKEIAEYLGVPVSVLLSEEVPDVLPAANEKTDSYKEKMEEFARRYIELSPENKKIIDDMIAALRDKR